MLACAIRILSFEPSPWVLFSMLYLERMYRFTRSSLYSASLNKYITHNLYQKGYIPEHLTQAHVCPFLSPLITCIDLWAYQCNQNIELFSHQNDLAHTPLTTIVSPTSPPLPQLVLRLYSPFLYFQYFKVQFPSVVTHTYNPSTQAEPGVKYIQHGWARQCYPVSKTNSGTPSSPPRGCLLKKRDPELQFQQFLRLSGMAFPPQICTHPFCNVWSAINHTQITTLLS